MKVAIALVSETVLDLGAFQPSAFALTNRNHVEEVDRNPGFSPLHDRVRILDDFAGNDANLSHAIMFVGIMFAGYEHDIAEVIEYTRGMPHLDTIYCERGVRCSIATGSLDQWSRAIVKGCQSHKLSTARYAFNVLYKLFDQRGLTCMFDGYRKKEDDNGTFLLEKK